MSVTTKHHRTNLLLRLARSLLLAVTAGTGLLSLTGFLGAYAYLLNLTSHFRVQYAFVLLGCSLLLWSLKKRKSSLIALSLAILNMSEILPLYQKPEASTSSGGAQFSLFQLNVLTDNQQFDQVRDEINRLDPDVVVMEEVTPEWYRALAPVRERYPYVVETLDRTSLGVMIMSRLPLEETELIDFNDGRLPSLVTELQAEGKPITLIATHPLSPRNKTKFRLRNKQLYAIARAFHERNDPLIMVGDLNITSFSPVFKKFIEQIDLYDSRKGFGVQPSWPGHTWLIARITLDHCLLSDDLQVKQRKLGNYVGSDHLPVYVEIGI